MDDRVNRRRFLSAGVAGVGALAAAPAFAGARRYGAPPPRRPGDAERVADATMADGHLRVLTHHHGVRRLRIADAVDVNRQVGIDALDATPLTEAFAATAFTSGEPGLVGSLHGERHRTFSTELNWELPAELAHLAERIPTSGTSTITEDIWEPAAALTSTAPPDRLLATPSTFGHVVAGSIAPGASRGSPSRAVTELGFDGQQIADTVRVALVEGATVAQHAPVGHHETVVAGYADDRAAFAFIRDDESGTLWWIDLGTSPQRREIGVVAGDIHLARWRGGVVMVTTEGDEVRVRVLRGGIWRDAPPRGRRRRGRGSPSAIPLNSDDELLLVADDETITVEVG